MALILAIDTTGEHGSLALLRGQELLEEVRIHAPTGFSHLLYGEIEALLARHAVALREIECFASASGPGAFTGVRVCLACVKGLAEALGRPAVAVSNLEALARFGSAPLRGAVLDARRGDLYGAVYDAEGRQVTEEVVAAPDAWLASLPAGVEEFVTAGFPLEVALPARVIAAPHAMAAQIARIAAARLGRGEACDPAALDANYVRRADAELSWKEY
uniref:Peptidase M22, glycoprotease n=1 Tax=Solibacter usitatus (strain Ellin6076) TaxID=234267 RepID=Q01UU5_SOLUE